MGAYHIHAAPAYHSGCIKADRRMVFTGLVYTKQQAMLYGPVFVLAGAVRSKINPLNVEFGGMLKD